MRASSNMRRTSEQKTIGATDLASDGLFPFQVAKKTPSFAPPEGRKVRTAKRNSPNFPRRAQAVLADEETLTEIDELAMTSTLLDGFIGGIENEPQLTISIHVFYYLIQGDRGLDVPTLSQETGLSRNRVNGAIRALIATGKIKPLADNPNKYTLIRNGGKA